MPFIPTDMPGLLIFEPRVFEDSRGYFFESYNERTFIEQGIDIKFVQDNESSSRYGVIRGLHFQAEPHAQVKLIRVLRGSILDVVVDVRKGSPSYGKVFSLELTEANKKQLFIPGGFAHGFSVLSEVAIVSYKCNAFYNKESEAGIRYDDPRLGINWQIPAGKEIVSDKDKVLPLFADSKINFDFKG